jgi:class 3 adenylate cyclase
MCPSADPALARWWEARARASASPGAARALIEMNSQIDVRDVLASVRVPALVLHRRGDRDSRVEEGQYIAERIPEARFIELTGVDHVPWIDADQIVDEVEEFLTGARASPRPRRVLATILVTDIVRSTEKVTELGDRTWAELLASHHQALRRKLRRFSGEEIDTAGDGFLALFDGPARAIRCALAVTQRVSELGLSVRVGVHTGEVERPGREVRGIAVHIAARVAAEAGPGEVLAPATTRDLVAGSGLTFSGRGERRLKGLEEPKRLFAAQPSS